MRHEGRVDRVAEHEASDPNALANDDATLVPDRSPEAGGELPRRVLHVLNNALGGATESTLSIIEGLAARGVESSVVCHRSPRDGPVRRIEELVDGRVHYELLWWWNRRIRTPTWRRGLVELRNTVRTGRGYRSARAVERFAAAQGVDLVHTSTVLTPEGAWAARALGLPHVWHLRELVGPGHPFRFWDERRFISRRVMGSGEVLVANSHCAAAAARAITRPASAFDESRVRVVLNGVEVQRFEKSPPPAEEGEVVVGMVANLTSRWKQHELFIEAVATIDPSLPVRYIIVGSDPVLKGDRDPYATKLHRRATELGLGSRLQFVGAISNPVRIMGMLDVLAHPCGQESFGRVAIEAMAAGRPVVAVKAGGMGEVVRDGRTGLLVPPDDAVALGSAIERLVRNPAERKALGAAGPEEIRERYSIDDMIDGVLDAYRIAAASVGSRPDR